MVFMFLISLMVVLMYFTIVQLCPHGVESYVLYGVFIHVFIPYVDEV
jgi:hypothetical protein